MAKKWKDRECEETPVSPPYFQPCIVSVEMKMDTHEDLARSRQDFTFFCL